MSRLARIRTGINRNNDGRWEVVVGFDNVVIPTTPDFATEAEAEAKANECAALLREGLGAIPTSEVQP